MQLSQLNQKDQIALMAAAQAGFKCAAFCTPTGGTPQLVGIALTHGTFAAFDWLTKVDIADMLAA